ncbi:MAG TPA: acyl-CoA dehydratase activase-related protein [Selenomonadales bacterium]|nr:acyl-CoA dehydratase activase-related protein [Selenomonadales bacterium]
MSVKVGIPRALLYYYHGDAWREFFRLLGAEPVVSGETTQATVAAGGGVDEVCLPVKVFFGHACELAGKVDYLFVPRIISLGAGQYSCPKMMGLPDLLKACYDGLPPLLDMTVRWSRLGPWPAVAEIGRRLGKPAPAALWAWYRANRQGAGPAEASGAGGGPAAGPRVALVGHPYLLRDRQVSMDILRKLRGMGVRLLLADAASAGDLPCFADRLPKKIFWHYCRKLAGAALALLHAAAPPDGLVFVTSFSCGPDSLIGEIIKSRAAERGVPFLLLTVDEHTAEAGFVTRLEAFVDMLSRRNRL